MLIDIAELRPVGRDLEVQALIDYLDQPEKSTLSDLTDNDLDLIDAEFVRCRTDFRYTARNYFWITTKDRGDVLLNLFDAQELIYEEMQRLKALGLPQKLLTVKSRQLGCSTLIEGLIAWRTIFFRNVRAIVVSYDEVHAAALFAIMQHIYDMLPWWMKPMLASREFKKGLWFENPDPNARRMNPGLNSQIQVKGANTIAGGIGQGYAIHACHASEFPSWLEKTAKRVIDEDLGHSLADNPEVFAFLEGTGKGAGKYAHQLWKRNEELGARARWHTIFLPSFLDKSHFIAPPQGWLVQTAEHMLRERIEREWARCDAPGCRQHHRRRLLNRDRLGEVCPTCKTGILQEFSPADGFLYWIQQLRENAVDEEARRKLSQEQAVTPSQAFQVIGKAAFGDEILDYVDSCIRDPLAMGTLDKHLRMHVSNAETGECRVSGCPNDHRYDGSNFWIWEFPDPGEKYTVGVDVSSGMGGNCDYGVIWVNKVSHTHQPDKQVARFRANDVLPSELGITACRIATWYNTALLAIEYNTYTSCGDAALHTIDYPNLYRWKIRDTLGSGVTQRVHWITNFKTRPAIFDTGRRYLRGKQWEIMSRNCLEEMKTCKIDEDETRTEHQKDFKDDELVAGLIALRISHEDDYDPDLGFTPLATGLTMETAPWHMSCDGCGKVWPANDPMGFEECPDCNSQCIRGEPNTGKDEAPRDRQNSEAFPGAAPVGAPVGTPRYDDL